MVGAASWDSDDESVEDSSVLVSLNLIENGGILRGLLASDKLP